MNSTPIPLNGIKISDLMRASQESFYRIEALENYKAKSEDDLISKYCSGEVIPPVLNGNTPWFQLIKSFADKGRPLQRIRVLSRNISPYLRFETEWGYNLLQGFGEQFNIVLKEQHPNLKEAWDAEYYVIDNKRVVYLNYDENGTTLGFSEETNPSEIERRISHKNELVKVAVPYRNFLAHLRTKASIVVPDLDMGIRQEPSSNDIQM
jgi:hypothetical protein